MRLISSLIFCALFFVSSVVFACMHGPHVEQTKFHVALALVNGKQTIVIKPEIRTKGSKMGWVFLVPKVPTMMAVGKSDVLDVMNKHFFPRQITKGGRSKSKVALKVGKRTKVGPFSITPIEGGYEGISKWLKKHGFGHIEEGHIKPYLDKGWVVLAAKIKVKKSKARTNARLKKMRANLKILKKETKQNTLFDPWDKGKRAFVPAGSSVRIRALQRQIRLEESNPMIDIPPLILQFRSKSIVFPWLFERTKKSAPFNFMVFTQKKILEERLQQFRSTHRDDNVTLRSYYNYKSNFANYENNFAKMKGMPKKVKRMMRRFGFRSKDKIYVQKIGAQALSHKEAVQKNLPDIEFILESASAPILIDY